MQLDTYERVKDKLSSTSAPFSLARQRLHRANSGLNGRPAPDNRTQGTASSNATTTSTTPPKSPFQTSPRPATTTPERVRAHKMLVASPVVDLTPTKQGPESPLVPGRAPPARQASVKAPVSPPLSHPPVLNSATGGSSRQQIEGQVAAGQAGEPSHGGPVTPERLPSGRMHAAQIPSGLAANDGEPGRNLKPIQTARSLSRGKPVLTFRAANSFSTVTISVCSEMHLVTTLSI